MSNQTVFFDLRPGLLIAYEMATNPQKDSPPPTCDVTRSIGPVPIREVYGTTHGLMFTLFALIFYLHFRALGHCYERLPKLQRSFFAFLGVFLAFYSGMHAVALNYLPFAAALMHFFFTATQYKALSLFTAARFEQGDKSQPLLTEGRCKALYLSLLFAPLVLPPAAMVCLFPLAVFLPVYPARGQPLFPAVVLFGLVVWTALLLEGFKPDYLCGQDFLPGHAIVELFVSLLVVSVGVMAAGVRGYPGVEHKILDI